MKLKVILSLCSLILAGCSSVQQTVPEQAGLPLSWQQHVEKVKLIQNWQANAQVAITIGTVSYTHLTLPTIYSV